MCGKPAEKEYEIHYYEVDKWKRVLPTSIMDYFSDICTMQSDSRGITLDYMADNNIAWILYKWDINIKRYPLYGETVKVITIPYSFRKFYAYREFKVVDASGEVVITADSMWFLIDTVRRRPLKVPETMFEAFGIGPDENTALEIRKIEPPEECDLTKEFNVRYSDIDTNQHVNNVKYAAWILEAVPLNIILDYTLKNINITYEKETFYGDMIKACTKIHEAEGRIVCTHKILDSGGNVLTVAETIWEK